MLGYKGCEYTDWEMFRKAIFCILKRNLRICGIKNINHGRRLIP